MEKFKGQRESVGGSLSVIVGWAAQRQNETLSDTDRLNITFTTK